MKTTYSFLLILTSIFLFSCGNVTISTGDGSQKIKGNGKTTSDVRTVGAFKAIDAEGVFDITLLQGDKESVKVETDENIVPVIITEVKNDTLNVKFKDDISLRDAPKINVYITLVNIGDLKTDGVGALKCPEALHLKSLHFTCDGVGATHLNLLADKLIIKSEIVGALKLSGKVKDVTIDHSGVGVIEAFELSAENLSLTTSGVGAAEVNASNSISIDASGVGDVKYKGGALTKNIKSDGVGKVVEIR